MAAPRLLIVTGKGGVGKTTIAAALGRAAGRSGRRVLIAETASPGRLAGILGVPPLGPEPRAVDRSLSAVALDEGVALAALVDQMMPLRLLSRRLLSSETFRIVAAAVPGIPEAALLAQLVGWLEAGERRRAAGFDLIILDSPASGHSVPLLSAPRTLGGIAAVGPLAHLLGRISGWLVDPERTRALVVSIPERWAVAEAIELYASLRDDLGVPVARPVLNAVFPRRFTRAEEELLGEAEADASVDPALLAAGRYFIRRREEARGFGRELRRGTAERPIEVPFVFSARMTIEQLDPIADALESLVA